MNAEVKTGYKLTELGLMPVDWSLACLGNICDVRDGTHDSPKLLKKGVPFVTSKNIVDGKLDLDDVSYISEEDAAEINKRSKVDENDIIMAMIGTIGTAARIDVEPNFCIKNVALLKPKSINSRFIFQLICSPIYQAYINNNLDGGIQKFISLGTLRSLHVPMPDLDEQRAIATALSDMDALISGLDQLIAKKRDIKQATMQQLLTGQTRLPGFGGEWEVKRLGDMASLRRENVIPENNGDQIYTHFSLPAFDLGKEPMIEAGSEIGSNKFRVPQDAVLVSKLNPRIPRVWAPDNIPEHSVASTEFLVLVAKGGVSRRFLFTVCASPIFCDRMEGEATGTTGSHQRISPAGALNIEVMVPVDIEEQAVIADILFDMDAELATLEARRDKAKQLKQGMMQELLTGRIRLV